MKKLGKLKLNLSNNDIKIGIYVTKLLELKLEIIQVDLQYNLLSRKNVE